MWQQRRQIGDKDGMEWQEHAARWMSALVSFVPSPHHELHVLGLWFFAISLVQDKRWSLRDKELNDKVPFFLSFFFVLINQLLFYFILFINLLFIFPYSFIN